MQHHEIPSLVDETPLRVILHGCNDVSNRNASPEQIANVTKDLAEMCRGYRVNKIFVSSLISKKKNYLNEQVTKINFLVHLIYKEKGFVFIDDRNINVDNLLEDGLHFIERGKVKLARNFIDF